MSTLSTKITEKMIINADGKDIVLNGLDFTENGYLEIQNANSVVVKNCRVYKLNCENTAKNYWMKVVGDIPVQLKVLNSFFGPNPGTNGKMYNLFEMNAKLKNKSAFSSNWFNSECCTHNAINIYGAEEGASISVNNNYYGNCGGTTRIGIKGEPACTIISNGNIGQVLDPTDFCNNFVMCEPYGKETPGFANLKIVAANNTFIGEGADPYMAYSGKDDTLLCRKSAPKLTVHDEETTIPIRYSAKLSYVAVIGSTGYNTLAEAIAAANGEQITLIKSVDEEVDLTDVDLVGSIPGLTVNGVEVKF